MWTSPGGIPFKNTVYRYIKDETDIGERAGNVEYYLLDGTKVLNQGHGVWLTRAKTAWIFHKRPSRCRAKSLYGAKTVPGRPV